MSPQVSLAAVTAPADVLDAVQRVVRRLNGPRSAALAVFNFTDLDLVLDRAEHERGAFGLPPGVALPARTVTAFSVREAGSVTGISGRLDWRGTHADNGEFHFEVEWSVSWSAAPTASARAVHRLPGPGGATRAAGGMAIDADFLRAAAVTASDHAIVRLYYELHPRTTGQDR